MAEKVANLRLSLKAQGAKSGLRDLKGEGERTAKEMGSAFRRHMSAGLKSGLDSIKGGFSNLKTFVAGLGLFAGLPGIKEQVGHAIQMEARYRRLAFAIKSGTGEAVRWRDVQRQIESVALATGNKTDELAESFDALRVETGDVGFAQSAFRDIAAAATASGEGVAKLTAITGKLNEFFGVTKEEVPEALRAALSLSNKGGISLEDMAEKLSVVGASAKSAGLEGVAGFSKVAALLNMADGSTGSLRKGIAAVSGIIDTLGSAADRSKVLVKLGLDPGQVKGDATETIGAILQKTGGKKEKLEAAFKDDQLRILVDLGQRYATAFAETQGDVKAKTAAALDAYRTALQEAGKSTLSEADMRQQFADEMESTERKIQVSLTRLEQAFARPEMTEAISRLAKTLPPLAETLSKFAGFAVENPGTAMLGAGAFFGAKGFLEGAIGSAFSRGATAAAGTMAQGIAGSGPALAAGFGSKLGPIGAALGIGVGLMIIQAIREAEQAERDRAAQGKEAMRVLDADRQNINEVLRQQGIEVDPLAGLNKDMAGRATRSLSERDKVEAAIDLARGRGSLPVSPEQKERLLAKFGGEGVPQFSTPGPNQSVSTGGSSAPSAPPRHAPAPQDLAQLIASKELRVRVVNPKEIGGAPSSGALGGATPLPGWMGPR